MARAREANVYTQRADLTYRHNLGLGRHGWLRLTPAYSVRIVEQVLSEKKGLLSVLDPFSGTATTTLCAAMRGYHATSVEINPFLAWFGRAKVAIYSPEVISKVCRIGEMIFSEVGTCSISLHKPPAIFNIERWWDKSCIQYLCAVKGLIRKHAPSPSPERTLLDISFCRTLIALSNAAFNHQSMSFKPDARSASSVQCEFWESEADVSQQFLIDLDAVLIGARANPPSEGSVLEGDSRHIDQLVSAKYDLLVTSPPYPNRMSYIRELRPYMYWLDYLKEAREAGEMDWQAIGGTWGIATSRLSEWRLDNSTCFPDYLHQLLNSISGSDSKSGGILANYVGKYFEDMWVHFVSVRKVMKHGADVHYIVGNSKFYDWLVPVEQIFVDMLERAGFSDVRFTVLRKRNSKKELLEFDVTGRA